MGQAQGRDEFDVAVPTWELDELSTHPSYHGTMDRDSADTKLREQDSSCYLTRYSRTRKVYVLSVIKRKRLSDSGMVKHFKLKIEKQRDRASFEIHGAQRKFNCIAKMLDFYQQTHLNHDIGTIGNCLENETRFFKPIDLEDGETSPLPSSPVHEIPLNNSEATPVPTYPSSPMHEIPPNNEPTPGQNISPVLSVNSSYESRQRHLTATPPQLTPSLQRVLNRQPPCAVTVLTCALGLTLRHRVFTPRKTRSWRIWVVLYTPIWSRSFLPPSTRIRQSQGKD